MTKMTRIIIVLVKMCTSLILKWQAKRTGALLSQLHISKKIFSMW